MDSNPFNLVLLDSMLVISVIMFISSLIIIILGRKRAIPNAILWALFPLFHGFHEFVDYLIMIEILPLEFEKLMIILAFGASSILLAAIIEFFGYFPHPMGKIASLIGGLLFIIFIWAIPLTVFQELLNYRMNLFIFHTDPFRLLFGVIFCILDILFLVVIYRLLVKKGKVHSLEISKNLKRITKILVLLLIFHAFFEGFASDSNIFLGFRTFSRAIFIVIPLVIILNARLGLQRLLIIHENGNLVFGYSFSTELSLTDPSHENEYNQGILISGFLSAISTFSQNILAGDKSFVLQSDHQYFILAKDGVYLFALQSINNNKELEKAFRQILSEIGAQLKSNEDSTISKLPEILKKSFSRF